MSEKKFRSKDDVRAQMRDDDYTPEAVDRVTDQPDPRVEDNGSGDWKGGPIG